MKKSTKIIVTISIIFAILFVWLMIYGLFNFEKWQQPNGDETQNQATVGDILLYDGIAIKLSNVESGKYFNNIESRNGSFVKITLQVKNTSKTQKRISKFDFVIVDTYTRYETTYYSSGFNYSSGDFTLLPNDTIYEFVLVYDIHDNPNEKEVKLLYEYLFLTRCVWYL